MYTTKSLNKQNKSSENKFDLREVLHVPLLYWLFRKFVGGDSGSERLVRDFIKPFSGARILDLGCGPGSMLSFLPDDIEYVGYDVNLDYIKYASKKFGQKGSFHCGKLDKSSLGNAQRFDIVLAIGFLHHVEDNEAGALLKTAANNLAHGGYLVTLDPVYVKGQSKLAKFIISKDRGNYIRTPDKYLKLAKSEFREVQTSIVHDLLRIPLTNIIMKCFK